MKYDKVSMLKLAGNVFNIFSKVHSHLQLDEPLPPICESVDLSVHSYTMTQKDWWWISPITLSNCNRFLNWFYYWKEEKYIYYVVEISHCFTANFVLFPAMKEFRKSVKVWISYCQNSTRPFWDTLWSLMFHLKVIGHFRDGLPIQSFNRKLRTKLNDIKTRFRRL